MLGELNALYFLKLRIVQRSSPQKNNERVPAFYKQTPGLKMNSEKRAIKIKSIKATLNLNPGKLKFANQ